MPEPAPPTDRIDRVVWQMALVALVAAVLLGANRWQLAAQQARQVADVIAENARVQALALLHHDAERVAGPDAAAALERLVEASDHHMAASLFEAGRSRARHARFSPGAYERSTLVDPAAVADGTWTSDQGVPVPAPGEWGWMPPARVVQVETTDQQRQLRVIVSLHLAQAAQQTLVRQGLLAVLAMVALVALATALMVWGPRRRLAAAARYAERLPAGVGHRLSGRGSGLTAVDALEGSLNRVADTLDAQRAEQRQARSTIEQALAQAEAGSRAKTRFLANMSHEMRTPLHGVIGTLDLALRSGAGRGADTERYLRTARASAAQLLHLVNEILDLSKVEAGRMELSPQPLELRPALEGVLAMFGALAADKGLALRLDWQPADAPSPTVLVDGQRLRQVLVNLVGNAVKFTARGEVCLRARLLEEGAPSKLGIAFEVQDTGSGIAPERLAQLFEPFTQGDESTSRVYGGTGLGLSIAHRLVALLGGELALHAPAGGGTRAEFALALPCLDRGRRAVAPRLAPDGAQNLGADSFPLPLDAPPLAGWRVLLAEDNEVNALVATSALELLGATVRRAANGAEAVRLAQAEPPFDAVLMDLQMPVMDGHQAAAELRRLRIGGPAGGPVPVVALTAHLFADDLRGPGAAPEHMDAYLGKPFTTAALLQTLLGLHSARTST